MVKWKAEGKVDGDSDDLVRLYLGLKLAMKGKDVGGSITLHLMNQWKKSILKEVSLTRGFYVNKADMPELNKDERVQKWLRNLYDVVDWPADLEPDEFWLVSDSCDKQPLGDVMRLELKVATVSKAPRQNGGPQPPFNASPANALPALASPSAKECSEPAPPANKRRRI